jgi:hypothetical protein
MLMESTVTAPKVFCIGFQKTGTTSLESALKILGYRVTSIFGRDLSIGTLRRDYIPMGLQIAQNHDAVQDMPWPLMYRELDEAFPGSRFILTWRESDRWIRSIVSHFGANPNVLQQLTYGDDAPFPVGHEYHYRHVYDAHNAAVRAYFRDRPQDLLEMNLSQGDGWEKLCAFLEAPVPAVPFPRENSAQARQSLAWRVRKRLKRLRTRLLASS